jgi:hypothetical protein
MPEQGMIFQTMGQHMKRLYIVAAMTALLLCAPPVLGKSVHDNNVYFTNVYGFSFHLNEHYITDGQPWLGAHSHRDGNKGFITIRAGRHSSEYAARWFKDRADLALGARTSADWPDKLNFAIYGDLLIKGSNGGSALCRGVVIGQGHVGGYNNWWIGARDDVMKEVGGHYWLQCESRDGHCGGVILISTHDSDTFPLEVHTCPPPGNHR